MVAACPRRSACSGKWTRSAPRSTPRVSSPINFTTTAATRAPRAIAAVLNLASARLTQLGAVVRGDVAAAWIRAPHNLVEDGAAHGDADVWLDADARRPR